MRKRFLGVNMDMDEMLQAKQQASATRAFWCLLLMCHACYFFQSLALAQPFSQTWPTFLLSLTGTVVYVVLVFRARIPLLPRISRRALLAVILGFSIFSGVFIGVRNIFFLYAENMVSYTLAGKIWMAAQIAALISVEFAVLSFVDLGVLVLHNRWQNRRIERMIEIENEAT